MRLVVLFTSFFIMLLIAGGIAFALQQIPGVTSRTSILLSTVAQCVLAFCIPSFVTAKFSSSSPLSFLGLSRVAPIKTYLGVLIVFLIATPAMNQLVEWNANLHFPEWASGFEKTLRDWENNNGSVAETALAANSFIDMLVGILIIGVITGFSEELFFRGTLQTVFVESGIGKIIAVWSGALIFSAIHFQFFGFVPRLLMGAFFGFLLVWTGSIWPGVFAHALNNSIVVFSTWLFGNQDSELSLIGVSAEGEIPWATIFSVAATFLFLYQFRRYFFFTKPNT